jgi:hypothetical protein
MFNIIIFILYRANHDFWLNRFSKDEEFGEGNSRYHTSNKGSKKVVDKTICRDSSNPFEERSGEDGHEYNPFDDDDDVNNNGNSCDYNSLSIELDELEISDTEVCINK